RRCLDRDVKNRLRDIGEARIAIERYLANPVPAAAAATTVVAPQARLPWIIAAAAVLAAAAFGYVILQHQREEPPAPLLLSFLPPGANSQHEGVNGQPTLAVSPDGLHIAFEATIDGKQTLWLRDLDSRAGRMLPHTDRGRFPFWSPDSRFIGFYQSGK